MQVSSNFAFLAEADEKFARLGALAERYFSDDAPGALVKLRQLAEFLAKDVAARHGLLPATSASFDDVLRALKLRNVLPRQIADLFHHLRIVGNAAAHENIGTTAQAFTALKIAREAAIWYHRSYCGAPDFKPGPFVPPTPPATADTALRAEMEELRITAQASANAAAKALLAYQQAEAARLAAEATAEEQRRDREFWEQYASETERALRSSQSLQVNQTAALQKTTVELEKLASFAHQTANQLVLDEATTRVLIDDKLRAAGWIVDTRVLRYANGVRPQAGQNIAIAEWPTASGPVDYALFVDGKCVGVIEAKREIVDVRGRLGQAKRYARDIQLSDDQRLVGAPWSHALEQFHAPFVFATNGRPYVKQLETVSGIWFWDARPDVDDRRALSDWFSPRDLVEKLEQVTTSIKELAERELGVQGLRPYQRDAMAAVENALSKSQRNILLAMATGTGKTRLAIAMMFELLHRKRFRRILFLVDRNALGEQALQAMSNTDTSGFLKFDQVFPVADLARKFPEATDRVQVATVQAMIRRLFDDPDEQRPTPGTYDLIIVDEAHRGYVLDAELREEDLGFRNLEDYVSAYRRVLDYFDATRIALTATPALHTREIFGTPVFHYSYRQAVIDGWLIDHRPPKRIVTALSLAGITFDAGEDVNILDPRTRRVDLINLPDQVDFEIADFNRKVHTKPFNHAVAQAVALHCPPDQPGKTLLFAARDDHADILVEELIGALKDEYGTIRHDMVEKITGSVDRPLDRIKAFKNDPNPKYVVTVDLLTTGIDVPAIVNLVFVRRVNSRILYDQMIGRATRRCDEIGKDYFRIFDAVDIYANLQEITDMRPVVVDPALTLATLLGDLERAGTDEDRAFVRDQIVVKLRQKLRQIEGPRREALETLLAPLDQLPDRLNNSTAAEILALFHSHAALVAAIDAPARERPRDGIYISEHADELISVEDNFGNNASPADYIHSFEAFVRTNMNAHPALIAATQKPRDLTRKELRELATLLDAQGFSEASLRQAYGRTRNADIAAHIIGFVRQAALGDALVPYETRVENAVRRLLDSRAWTNKQRRWLERIGRALRDMPVGDSELLTQEPFANQGGFAVVDQDFDHHLADVLKDLNAAIWDDRAA